MTPLEQYAEGGRKGLAFLGSMLFTRRVSGPRIVMVGEDFTKKMDGIPFRNFGAHHDELQSALRAVRLCKHDWRGTSESDVRGAGTHRRKRVQALRSISLPPAVRNRFRRRGTPAATSRSRRPSARPGPSSRPSSVASTRPLGAPRRRTFVRCNPTRACTAGWNCLKTYTGNRNVQAYQSYRKCLQATQGI